MNIETTAKILSAIFTRAELTEIANHIGEASFHYRDEKLDATAEGAWRIRKIFIDASREAEEKQNGHRYRWY